MSEALARQLARQLTLPFESCTPHPSRSGELFRVQLGGRGFALKHYDEGPDNDLYFFGAAGVPVPTVYAVRSNWVLMDWLEGDRCVTDPYSLGRELGTLVRHIHGRPVDGAGRRTGDSWEFADWSALVASQAARDHAQIPGFDDSAPDKAAYHAIVDRFAALARPRSVLLHGDLGLDNLIVEQNRVVAFFDTGWCIGGAPLMDVAYFLNSSFGKGEGGRGFLDGYGARADDDLVAMRMYLYVGKLGYFHATGNRERYAQRRESLLQLVADHGLR